MVSVKWDPSNRMVSSFLRRIGFNPDQIKRGEIGGDHSKGEAVSSTSRIRLTSIMAVAAGDEDMEKLSEEDVRIFSDKVRRYPRFNVPSLFRTNICPGSGTPILLPAGAPASFDITNEYVAGSYDYGCTGD